jgi:hypothetical protein
MAIEYDLKVNHQITWQDFVVEKKEPDHFYELKSVCSNLFLNATGIDTHTNPIDFPEAYEGSPNALASLIIRELENKVIDESFKKILIGILLDDPSQKIIDAVGKTGMLRDIDPWEVMQQIECFQRSQDTSVLLSILGKDVP